MGFQKGNTLGNRFSSENQPKKGTAGRKPFIGNKLTKGTDALSAYECKRYIQKLILMSREKILELASNPKMPIFQAVIAKALAEGDYRALMDLLKFTYGSSLDITTNGKDIVGEPIVIEVIDSREQVENTDDTDI